VRVKEQNERKSEQHRYAAQPGDSLLVTVALVRAPDGAPKQGISRKSRINPLSE